MSLCALFVFVCFSANAWWGIERRVLICFCCWCVVVCCFLGPLYLQVGAAKTITLANMTEVGIVLGLGFPVNVLPGDANSTMMVEFFRVCSSTTTWYLSLALFTVFFVNTLKREISSVVDVSQEPRGNLKNKNTKKQGSVAPTLGPGMWRRCESSARSRWVHPEGRRFRPALAATWIFGLTFGWLVSPIFGPPLATCYFGNGCSR